MITNIEKWHCLTGKRLSRLLQGITSNHNGDYSIYSQQSKIKSYEKVCKDHDHCHRVMPEKGKNILKYNQNNQNSISDLCKHRITAVKN